MAPDTTIPRTTDTRERMSTPGPWAFDGVRVFAPAFDEQVSVTLADGTVAQHGEGLIALVYSCGPILADFGGHHANGRLIAAAPMMYQELELAADTFRDFSNMLRVLGKDVMSAAADVAERHIREQLAAIGGEQ